MRRMLLIVGLLLLSLMGFALFIVNGGRLPSLPWPGSSVVSSPVEKAMAVKPGPCVLGPASVSADFINRVFVAYQSPARGEGQHLYEDGVQVGIDPVCALAFFLHESTLGRYGWGAVNHSLGNIRCSVGYACQGGYRCYASWDEGFKDWYRLIRVMYVGQLGLQTVETIIPVYAPNADHNDERAYIQALNRSVKVWRTGQVVV